MKPFAPAPTLDSLRSQSQPELSAIVIAAQTMPDDDYLHWEALRHLPPYRGYTAEQRWLALKLKRASSRITFPLLRAKNGDALTVTRHARLDEGVARMDRMLAGRRVLPEAARSEATRDQFIASSLMEEAIHSSLFEGAVSTREAAKDMLRSQRAAINRDERMILNNFRAMHRLREMAKSPLTLQGVLELHHIMTEGTLDRPEQSGRIQQPGETRVQVLDERIHRVVFVPPAAEQLPERMARLIEFANEDDVVAGQFVHPVLRSILLHFQLAYDHPFYDGNGRTARALFYWSMLRRGYWLAEYFSISRLLYQNRKPYELAYLQVESDSQDGTYFVLQQLNVLDRAVDELFAYVERKSLAHSRLRRRLQGRNDLNHRQLALLDHALRRSGAQYTHESHANSHRVSVITARSDLLALVEQGWLQRVRSGKRMLYLPVAGLDAKLD